MKKSNQLGFTLLEILLAIAVLSVMMMLIFNLTSDSSNTIDRVMAEDRDYMQIETAVSIIERDFVNIYNPLFVEVEKAAPTNGEKVETERTNFDGLTYRGHLVPVFSASEKDQLIFMTAGHQRRIENTKQSNFAWVRYSLLSVPSESKKEKSKEQYQLLRQYHADDPYNNNIDWEKEKAHILLDNISTLKFSYWDQEKKEYVDSTASLNEKQKYVRLARIEFTWIDRNGLENEVSRTFRSLSIPYDSSKEVQKNKSIPSGTSKDLPLTERPGDNDDED